MKITPEIQKRMDEIQAEAHSFINFLKDQKPTSSAEALYDVFYFKKLAELELKLESLELAQEMLETIKNLDLALSKTTLTYSDSELSKNVKNLILKAKK